MDKKCNLTLKWAHLAFQRLFISLKHYFLVYGDNLIYIHTYCGRLLPIILSDIWIFIKCDRQTAMHMSPPCNMHRWAQKQTLPYLLFYPMIYVIGQAKVAWKGYLKSCCFIGLIFRWSHPFYRQPRQNIHFQKLQNLIFLVVYNIPTTLVEVDDDNFVKK